MTKLAQIVIFSATLWFAEAWTTSTKSSFLSLPVSPVRSGSTIRMDTEQLDLPERFQVNLVKNYIPVGTVTTGPAYTLDEEAAVHGMPWQNSIDETYQSLSDGSNKPFYMSFWEWQLNYMKENLTNLRVLPVRSRSGKDLSYVENKQKGMRLHTLQCTCDEYKCIRMTVMDAGNKTQVFTSLWYPDPKYNLPVLGVDLLQFGQSKHLCIVDFQPTHDQGEAGHDAKYEPLLQPIRSHYPLLQGKMTQRFYDETAFFSNEMLLGRSDKDGANELVFDNLFPAYQAYVQTHVDLVQSLEPKPSRVPQVLRQHAAYDKYSAARDPAHGMLASSFGQEFADEYVHDILFPLSQTGATEQ